jgi:hypothetical protein
VVPFSGTFECGAICLIIPLFKDIDQIGVLIVGVDVRLELFDLVKMGLCLDLQQYFPQTQRRHPELTEFYTPLS